MLLYDVLKAAVPQNVAEFTRPIQSWVPGVTPISTTPAVITASLTYLVVVLGGQYLMRSLPAVPSKYVRLPFFLHNVLLSLGSLVLLVLYLERMLPFMLRFGIHNSVCLREVHSPEMEFLHIVNYYFKYWELLDTVFLVLKKKPLLFLHVYHHMATAALCYTQILGRTPMAWAVISLNLAVHVIMYGYYALSSLGIRCPWKKLITTSQIVQFVIDLFICCYGTWNHYIVLYWPWLPHTRYCFGEPFAAWSGIGILGSYLVLFILFYRKTYSAKPKVQKAK